MISVVPTPQPSLPRRAPDRGACAPSADDPQPSVSVRELRASCARIQAAADAERRRIEHALHDGAQQRLAAIRIRLALAAEQVAARDRATADQLRGLAFQIDEAIEEIRLLARGISPQALRHGGLVEALRTVVARSPIPTTLRPTGVGRYTPEIEAAAYFCCVEALHNAAKHARTATAVDVELSDDGRLHLHVRDNGIGFDASSIVRGTGLTSIHDRVAILAGTLTIQSTPHHGTHVNATIPNTTALRSAAHLELTPLSSTNPDRIAFASQRRLKSR